MSNVDIKNIRGGRVIHCCAPEIAVQYIVLILESPKPTIEKRCLEWAIFIINVKGKIVIDF